MQRLLTALSTPGRGRCSAALWPRPDQRHIRLSAANAQPGGVVIVSGPIGEPRITIMLARGDPELESDIVSDTAPLAPLAARLLDATLEMRRVMPTRGGVATVLRIGRR